MWVSVVRAQGLIGKEIVILALRYQEEEFPKLIARPGCVATALGVNQARGGALSLTFWESEQALLAGKGVSDETRDRLEMDFGRRDPYRVDRLETIYATEILSIEGGSVTPFVHLARFEGLTDSTTAPTTETCLKDSRLDAESRGCEGVVVAADPQSRVLASISFWESMRDLRAVRREYVEPLPGVALPYTDQFELVVAHGLDDLTASDAATRA